MSLGTYPFRQGLLYAGPFGLNREKHRLSDGCLLLLCLLGWRRAHHCCNPRSFAAFVVLSLLFYKDKDNFQFISCYGNVGLGTRLSSGNDSHGRGNCSTGDKPATRR